MIMVITTRILHRHCVSWLLVALCLVEILDFVPGANADGWDDYGHLKACSPVGTSDMGALTSEREGDLIVRFGRGVTTLQDFGCIWEIEIPNALQIVISFSFFDAFRVSEDYFWIYTNEWDAGLYVEQSSTGASPSEIVIQGSTTAMYYLLKALPADAREDYEWRGKFELSYRAIFADDEGSDDDGGLVESIDNADGETTDSSETDPRSKPTTPVVALVMIGLITLAAVVVGVFALRTYREKKRRNLPQTTVPLSSRNRVNRCKNCRVGAADDLGCTNGFALPARGSP